MNRQSIAIVIGSIVGATAINAVMMSCGATTSTMVDARADVPNVPADPAAAPAGSIIAYAGTNVPAGWLLCDGSAVSRTEYSGLFGAIGTTYGEGDMSATFNIPDLRGRTVVGTGQGANLTARMLAAVGGEERHTLTIAEMPAHSHRERGTNRLDLVSGGGIHVQDVDNDTFAQFNTYPTGGGQPHNVMPPFVVLNYIIKT